MSTRLRRSISLPQLVLYGLGTMVGGGIYALTGKVAGEAGMLTPLSFLLAGLLALVSAFSFAELSARYPFSAGEARYVDEAFHRSWLSALVGWLVVTTGVVSAGTLSVATVAFLQDLIAVPEPIGIVVLVIAMGSIAAWGIGESVKFVVAITWVEVGALVYIIFAAGTRTHEDLRPLSDAAAELGPGAVIGVMSGALLGFYAFVGFEDMVNMAEEVRDARRNLPRAILASVLLTTALYVIVSWVAVRSVPPEQLARANTPFAEIVGDTAARTPMIVVSLLTGINGALVQIIMASRVVYGLGQRSTAAPHWLAVVHPRTRTPLRATALMTAIVLGLALSFSLVTLAELTSGVMLAIFALLNLSLLRIKLRGDSAPEGAPCYPTWLSVAGLLASAGVLAFQCWSALMR